MIDHYGQREISLLLSLIRFADLPDEVCLGERWLIKETNGPGSHGSTLMQTPSRMNETKPTRLRLNFLDMLSQPCSSLSVAEGRSRSSSSFHWTLSVVRASHLHFITSHPELPQAHRPNFTLNFRLTGEF